MNAVTNKKLKYWQAGVGRLNLRIVHFCHSSCHDWSCIEYADQVGILHLSIDKGDAGYTEGCFHEIEVKLCPFCGYSP